jgi:hypothetical protein
MKPLPCDSQYLVDQYEALRREVTDKAWAGEPGTGLALFLRRGMSAWLDGLAPLAPPSGSSQREQGVPQPDRLPSPPPSVRTHFTTVLAGMILACAQPEGME